MDVLNEEQRHRAMLANKCINTSIEIRLRRALWSRGIRYRINYVVCGCRPDIVITKYKIAIFCDGSFWHGKRDMSRCSRYWQEKIKRNVERDLESTIELRDNGWIVLRFWEDEIKKHIDKCLEKVIESLNAVISRRDGI